MAFLMNAVRLPRQRRPGLLVVPPVAVEPMAPPSVREAGPSARALQDAVELVNAELESAATACRRQSERGMVQLHGAAEAASQILDESKGVADAAAEASRNVAAMAAAAEQLSATGQEIAAQAARSAAAARQAVLDSDRAANTTAALSEAANAIGEVVRAIASVAARTNLLALNATIEAARAGEAGRGFAIVAAEVKELSRQTAEATRQITARISGMQQATRASVEAMRDVSVAVAGIDEASAAVAGAVGQQDETIREVAARLQETAAVTTRVAQTMRDVADHSERVNETTAAARTEASAMAATVESLRGNLGLQLRRAASASRSVPLAMAVSLQVGGASQAATLLELSNTDALIRLAANTAPPANAMVQLSVIGVGNLPGRMTDCSGGRAVIALEPGHEAAASLAELLEQLRADGARFGDCARARAGEIAERIEAALRDGTLTQAALFDTNYQPIAGSDPPQFRTGFTEVADRIVRPVLDAALSFDGRVVGVFAVDQNGYAPTHNSNVSQPQRPGDPMWNARNCRNRWIFEDRAAIAAGRTTRDVLLQCYERNMGGGETMVVNECDSPIRVQGRHWGALRVMYRPP